MAWKSPDAAPDVAWACRTDHTVTMLQPPRLRIAPLLDLLCITSFVLIGGERHRIVGDFGWFFEVMWPLCVGIFGVALLTRLYTRADHTWLALTITWLGGIAVTQVLRGTFTHDPWFGIFTIIALTYLFLTMFGWRLIAALVTRRRAPSPA